MFENYEKAGKIASKLRKEAAKKAVAGTKVVDLIDYIEGKIISNGAGIAFPFNVSINNMAAHYTSAPGDDTLLCNGDLVKLDLGTEINGYIADTAVSIIVEGENKEIINEDGKKLKQPGRLDDGNPEVTTEELELSQDLIEASSAGLEAAISLIKPGVTLGEVGSVIEKTINDKGYKPIANLTGHSLEQWELHAGLSVPNISDKNTHVLEEGDHLAIEPFATNGVGLVKDVPQHYIYKYLRNVPLRQPQSKKLLKRINTEHRYLPFARRWFLDQYNEHELNRNLRPLITSRAIYPYNALQEKSGCRIAQTEHTVIIESDGCFVTTR